jgi:hypothetical protein
MHPGTLPANQAADNALEQRSAHLGLPPLSNTIAAPNRKDQTYTMQSNPLHIGSISFHYSGSKYIVTIKKDGTNYAINFETGKWLAGSTDMPGPSLTEAAKEDYTFLKPYKIDGSYGWQDEQTLRLKLRYIESPHTETITCHFSGNTLSADFEKSFDYSRNKMILTGEAEK